MPLKGNGASRDAGGTKGAARRRKSKETAGILRGAGFAGLEAGEGGGLVVEVGNDIEEAEHLEDHFYVAAGAEKFEMAVAIAERDEGADDGADAGAVELGDAFEIEKDVLRAAVD